MPTFSADVLTDQTGRNLGSSSLRWNLFANNVNISGTTTFTGNWNPKVLEDIAFADQFSGANVGAQIDAALANAGTLLVVIPSSMGAGTPSAIASGKCVLDLRSGVPKFFTNASPSAASWTMNNDGTVSSTFKSTTANPSGTGQLRLANADAIKSRNAGNSADLNLINMNSSNVAAVGDAGGCVLTGPLTIAGALAGCTTGAFSGQITSTLGSGTAPFSITSTTVVPNLNVQTLNGVTVSGTPSANQYLQASSASAATWVANTNAWSYSAGNKRWELYDSTITSWLVDAKPGMVMDSNFQWAFQEPADLFIISSSIPWSQVVGTSAKSNDGWKINTTNVGNNIAYMQPSQGVTDAATFGNVNSFWIQFDAIQTDANTQQRIGLFATAASNNPSTDGIYMECLGTDTNWFLVTRSGSTSTRVTTNIARAAGKQSFVVVKTANTSVNVYQPGSNSPVATSTTNIPTNAILAMPFYQVMTLTTVVKSFACSRFLLVGMQNGY